MDVTQEMSVTVFDLQGVIEQYTDMLFRISFSMTGSAADSEDILQNVFLRFHLKKPRFSGEAHCKAWLIRVTVNETKSFLRFRTRTRTVDLDALAEVLPDKAEAGVFRDILLLQPKYQAVMHLHYVEGYKTAEIADILEISPAAVRKRLETGRKQLKNPQATVRDGEVQMKSVSVISGEEVQWDIENFDALRGQPLSAVDCTALSDTIEITAYYKEGRIRTGRIQIDFAADGTASLQFETDGRK